MFSKKYLSEGFELIMIPFLWLLELSLNPLNHRSDQYVNSSHNFKQTGNENYENYQY